MKKDIKFSTRMASADREKIRALAQKAGLSMSDYVTACCLGKRIVIIDGLKDVLRQQKAIGNNLNQLTVLANMGKVQVANLDGGSSSMLVYNGEVQNVCASLYGSRPLPTAFIVTQPLDEGGN